jgi:hypothetical protein
MRGPDEGVAAGGRTQALIARLSSTVGKLKVCGFAASVTFSTAEDVKDG